MCRLLLLAAVLALQASPAAQSTQRQPSQADGVVRLLADIEAVLESGRLDDVRAFAAAGLPAADLETFQRSMTAGAPATATIRERSRRPDGDGYRALVDVLVSRGRQGRLATWQISARPKPGSPDRYEMAGLTELASIDQLLKLTLDPTREFAAHNLVFRAPDLTLRMPSGSAFVAESDAGVTILVLHGAGALHFAPPEAAEQGQLRVFAGHPEFDAKIDTAFIRINPGEFESRVSEHTLVATSTVDGAELEYAQKIFSDMAPKTFNLDLSDLSDERWSLEPAYGSLVVEFKAERYGWLAYARSPTDPEDISFFDRTHGHNLSTYASAEQVAAHGRFYSEDADLSYDIDHYRLDLTFDPARAWIAGRASLSITITQNRLNSLTFRLARSLAVSSVSSPVLGPLLALRVVGQNSLVVSLPKVLGRGEKLVVDVDYSGRLDPQVLSRDLLNLEGAVQVQNPAPVGPDETPIPPEPRFMYSSRVFWYPQPQVARYATASMRLAVPSEYQMVASGALVGATVAPVQDPRNPRAEPRSTRTLDFLLDRPAPYLACVISRFVPAGFLRVEVPAVAPPIPEVSRTPTTDSVTPVVNLEVVSTPRQAKTNRQLPARVADILRFYSKMIGEAPYPNFTVAAVDDNVPGGHSPAYFAILLRPLPTSPYSWQNDPVAFDSYPLFYLAHEVAHQWWGQAVEWKNYHEQWLSEGFAQYFAALYAGADRGPDTTRSLLSQMRRSAAEFSAQGPIYLGYRLGHIQGTPRVFRALVYNKAAVVLHMLRRLIGDDAFTAGIRRFYREWRFQKAGTGDLRAAFEAETALPLRRFFDQWVLGSTLPRLRVTSRVEPPGEVAVVRVEQIGEVFDLPLSVTVQYTDGRSEEITIAVTDAIVEQRIPLKGAVRRIIARDELTLATIVN